MDPPNRLSPKLVVIAFAFAAYAVMSAGGKYKSDVYGVMRGKDGKAHFAENPSFREWKPFEAYDLKGRPTAKSIIFRPLLWLDRKLVHNSP